MKNHQKAQEQCTTYERRGPGQQHLNTSKKDIEETVGIKGGGEAFSFHTDSGAKVGIFTKGKCGFSQDIEIERRHILSGSGGVLIKNDI